MTVTAKVICDSISPDGIRLTTLQLRYPRMIHADFMTHRVFSRNGRSSRAVPFAILVKEEPYIPDFCYNQKGMVAGDKLTTIDSIKAQDAWLEATKACQRAATTLSKIGDVGVHKQWVNRMLEWFGYIDVLVTATSWSNFFALRDEAGAQPEIIELAKAMKIALGGSKPKTLNPGQWHLPYIDHTDWYTVGGYLEETTDSSNPNDALELLKKISVARCARLTIKPFDGNASIEAELKRYDLLMVSRPVHASPAEHIASPDYIEDIEVADMFIQQWGNKNEHGNFTGWRQFRKQIPFNTVED